MGNAKSRVVLEHEVLERKSKYYTRSRQKSVYMQVHICTSCYIPPTTRMSTQRIPSITSEVYGTIHLRARTWFTDDNANKQISIMIFFLQTNYDCDSQRCHFM